jgi:hypothetical protein
VEAACYLQEEVEMSWFAAWASLVLASDTFDIALHDREAQTVLNKVLGDDAYWSDAQKKTYEDRLYDEIRLKSTDTGYVPMITGEGDQDFERDVVADIVFQRSDELPRFLGGCKVALPLGQGTDPVTGTEYRDLFFLFDFQVFYGFFAQRMYRRDDPQKGETVLWFEKIDASFVDASTWSTYQQKMKEAQDKLERRWPPFGSLVEVDTVYGLYVVGPGRKHSSRVSFVSRLGFDDDAGFVAQWGSQLRPVLRSAIAAGFEAQVAIAKEETERRKR